MKYEDVYLRDYQTPPEAVCGLGRYFAFYNHSRLHQSLDWRTPAEVYGAPPTAEEARWLREFEVMEAGPEAIAAAAPLALRARCAAAAPPGMGPP